MNIKEKIQQAREALPSGSAPEPDPDEWVDPKPPWKTRAMRVAVIGVCAIVGIAGLRSIFLPRNSTVQQVTDSAAAFPASEAQGVAARYTTAYLSLGDAAARKTALGLDSAQSDGTLDSWNGSGSLEVETVHPSAVRVERDGRRAVVTVLARVATKPAAASKAPAKPAAGKPPAPKATNPVPATRWVALAVPVAVDGGRVSVAGTPAFVGLPAPKAIAARDMGLTDGAVAQQSRSGIEAFFRAYGGTDAAAVDQAAAPGAHVAPLGGGFELVDILTWVVSGEERDADGGKERAARATVRWRVAGAELTQGYDVTLALVSSGSIQSWRVKAITAAH